MLRKNTLPGTAAGRTLSATTRNVKIKKKQLNVPNRIVPGPWNSRLAEEWLGAI
jgi:hypothetical protein